MAKKYVPKYPSNVKLPDKEPGEYVQISADRRMTDHMRRAELVCKRGKSPTAKWLVAGVLAGSEFAPISYRFCRTNFGAFVRSMIIQVWEEVAEMDEAKRRNRVDVEKRRKSKKMETDSSGVRKRIRRVSPGARVGIGQELDESVAGQPGEVPTDAQGWSPRQRAILQILGLPTAPREGSAANIAWNRYQSCVKAAFRQHGSDTVSRNPMLREIAAKYESVFEVSPPETPAVRSELAEKYPQYYKKVPGHVPRDEVDTYVINMMFPLNDPTGTLLHARKKLLVPGVRSGGKEMRKDITEARDSLNRWLALNPA